MIYIREAHPTDGWVSKGNVRAGIKIADPKNSGERTKVAIETCSKLKIDMPCLIDSMDDKANKAYGAWPDRIFVIGIDGKLKVTAGRGPSGFPPAVKQTTTWLAENIK